MFYKCFESSLAWLESDLGGVLAKWGLNLFLDTLGSI